MENIIIWMVQFIKGNGMKISNMVMDLRSGQMGQNMKASTNSARRMERVDLIGLMDHHMLENSQIITYMGLENISGKMAEKYRNI